MLQVAEDNLKAYSDPFTMDEKLKWSLELSTQALRLTESATQLHERALSVATSCLDAMAAASKNPCARNFFLVKKKMIINSNWRKIGFNQMLVGRIRTWPIEITMEKLRLCFEAESCDDQATWTVIFTFPDVGQVHSNSVRHCILDHLNTPELIPNHFDAKVTLTSDHCKELLTNKNSFASLQQDGNVKVEGEVESFVKFMNLLDI